MPGSPATTTYFDIPRYADSDAATFSADVNAISDGFDAALGVRDERVAVKGTNYTAVPGDCIFASAAITVTLPSAPDDSTSVGIVAESGSVTVNRGGSDTISSFGVSANTITVVAKTFVRLRYHSGVWHRAQSYQVAGGDVSGTLDDVTVNTWGGQTKAQVVAGNTPKTHESSHLSGGSDALSGLLDSQLASDSLVTVLPGSPYDGQTIFFQADSTHGVVWRLRYNAGSASSYKWEYVGGPPLVVEDNTTVTDTSSNVYIGGSTALTITLPSAFGGDFDVEIGGSVEHDPSASGTYLVLSYKIGSTAAQDSDGWSTSGLTANELWTLGSRTRRKTGFASGVTLTSQYKQTGADGQTWVMRRFSVTPVRVG